MRKMRGGEREGGRERAFRRQTKFLHTHVHTYAVNK